MTGWPLDIDGFEYHPVPETWIDNGIDDRDGERPQLLAVSAAVWRYVLQVRYLHESAETVGQVIEPAVDGEGGKVPRRLKTGNRSRPIAARRLEPIDVAH